MKYRFSKSAKREFAEKMKDIENFCREEGISSSLSSDSYYFYIEGKKYRVSNHTLAASQSNGGHHQGETEGDYFQCITASKLRIKEIYLALKEGKKLDRRGNIIEG